MESRNCKNCEQEIKETYAFCPNCGQKAKENLTMGVLFYNTVNNYFSVDARFFKSFIPLIFRPGYLAKKFIEGKRLLYLHPAQYYLFTSVVFFFLFSFQSREYNKKADNALKNGFVNDNFKKLDSISKSTLDSISFTEVTKSLKNSQITISKQDEKEFGKLDSIIRKRKNANNILDFNKKKLDSLITVNAPKEAQLKAMGMNENAGFIQKHFYSQILKFQKNSGGGILQAFFDSIPITLFILLPIFAFILKLFFWKQGSYTYHLVFSFYHFSFLFVLFSTLLLVNLFFKIPNWINVVSALSTYFYLLIGIKTFYQQGYFLSFIKTGMIAFVYSMFVLPIALGMMIVASFLLY
ncbi:MAG: hypothetical protein COA88_09280 [Kordia sp.]|nr:MAG: hypothetical protein COA88_09280 [Kordia sp.]